MQLLKTAAFTLSLVVPVIASAFPEVVTSGAKNVVLVHGAYVDGSSWRQVHDQLWLKGYKVTVVRQSQATFDDNVAAARAAIDAQDGPVVLVGHDSGGAVISVAGSSDKVKALVYVAALLPAVGESVSQLTATRPLAQDALRATGDGRHVIDPAQFSQVFGADLPPNRTNFMSIAQPGVSRAALDAKASAAAWRNKPSYAIVATEDRLLSPDLQRWMYQRAGAQVTELKASHAVQLSQPEEVAQVLFKAALNVK